MGESDVRYVKGWDKRDEQRMRDVTGEIMTKTNRSEKAPVDYLNDQDLRSGE